MSLQCPKCSSVLIIQKRSAQNAGANLRSLSKVGHVFSTTVNTGKAGATVGMVAGPSGPLMGAFLGGVIGCISGCLLGARLGTQLDRQVLPSNHCLDCGYRFP